MRNAIPVLLLGFGLVAAGCGRSSEAAARAGRTVERSPLGVDAPVISTASSVPGGSEALGAVSIDIEAIERDSGQVGGGAPPGYEALSLKVKVTSRQETPRILVEPRRFKLEADGREILARPTARQEPVLRSTYLKAGKSVSGWISFEPPRGAARLVLVSDLRRPPITIVLPPGGQ